MRIETSELLHQSPLTIKSPDFGLSSMQVLGPREEKMFAPEISKKLIEYSKMVEPFLENYTFTMFHIRSRFAQSAITGELPDVKSFIEFFANSENVDRSKPTPCVRLKNVGNAAVKINVPCMSVWVSRAEYLTGEDLERQVRSENIQIDGQEWEYFFDEKTGNIPQGIRFYLDQQERYTIIPHKNAIVHTANGYHHGREVIRDHIMKIPKGHKMPFLLAQTADAVTLSHQIHGVIQGLGSTEGALDSNVFHLQSRMIEGGNTNRHPLKIEVKDDPNNPIIDSVDLKFLPGTLLQ